MAVAVRRLVPEDRAAWDVLWAGYLEFYETALAPGVTDETWRRLLDRGVDMHGLCALDAGSAPVGIVHYLFHPVTWSAAERCYLEDLFVAAPARGTGAGRALIEAVYTAADQRGADQVYWLTQDSNATARHLYDRVGQKTAFVKYQR